MTNPWLYFWLSLALIFFTSYLIEVEKKVFSALGWITIRLIATGSLIGGYGLFMTSVYEITHWSFWPIETAFFVCLGLIMVPINSLMTNK